MPFNKGDLTQQGVAGHVNTKIRLNEKRFVDLDLTTDENSEGVTITGTVTDRLNNQIYPIGSAPTGTIEITENGTVNVSSYASADVNVSGGSGSKVVVPLQSIQANPNITPFDADLDGCVPWTANTIKVTFDGVEYITDAVFENYTEVFSAENEEFKFVISSPNDGSRVWLKDANPHTIKVEVVSENVPKYVEMTLTNLIQRTMRFDEAFTTPPTLLYIENDELFNLHSVEVAPNETVTKKVVSLSTWVENGLTLAGNTTIQNTVNCVVNDGKLYNYYFVNGSCDIEYKPHIS